jgi:tripartite-type tricarboxylate transporter receptor subunit TctC
MGGDFMRAIITATVIGVALGVAAPASAQDAGDFPTKPLRLIVAASAGGSSDTVGRIVAEGLGAELGQRVVVENIAGVGSVAGLTALSQAAPDGYTIGTSNIAAIGINQHLMELPYKPLEDIIPIGMAMQAPRVLDVRADLPVKTVPELIQYMKDHPGELNYGSSGVGSQSQMGMELFMSLTGTKATHVPYNSSAEVGQAMAAGEVDVAFDNVTAHAPMADAGTVRFLATGCTKVEDIPQAKGLPTVQETVPDMMCSITWIGIFGPKGIPQPIVDKLNAALNKYLNSPEGAAQIKKASWDPYPMTPQELHDIWFKEADIWGKVIKDAGIKAQ